VEICFLRHGVAAERGPAYPDDGLRPLTEEGIARMVQAAAGLRTQFEPQLILTSPLVRARQTAEIVHGAFPDIPVRTCEELAGAELERLFEVLEGTRLDRVIATGHEPQLSMTVSLLVAGHEHGGVVMKKGGAALVRAGRVEPHGGELLWLLPPAVLRALGGGRPH
jgi:phosphohistidine phosphatase